MKQSRLSLNDVEWAAVDFDNVFENIYIAQSSDSNALEPGDVAFVGRSSLNNGFQGEYAVNKEKIVKSNCITISMVGDTKAFYQAYEFTCSQNILILRNDKFLNKINAKFLCTIINQYLNKKGYGYGYPVGLNRVKRNSLLIPINSLGKPNWKFMEDYIKQEQKDIAQKVISYYEQKMLEMSFDLVGFRNVEWKQYYVEEIFKVSSVKGSTVSSYKEGRIPYVSTSSQNNGVSGFIDSDKNISSSNCISVDPIAGNCFYHEYEFVGRGGAGSAINLLYNSSLNKYNSQFMLSSLEKVSKEKASYGIALNGQRLKATKIILPADKNGEPHWEYMSEFIKKLEIDNLEKVLEYIYIYIYIS